MDAQPARRLRAQRGLALYFACVVAGSGACELWMLQRGTPIEQQPVLALVNMWIPGLSSVIARLALREGFQDVSFALRGPGGWRSLGLAWSAPLCVGLLAYGAAWGLGLEAFAAPRMASVGMEQATPALKLATSLALNLSLGTLLASLSAVGEEIGWRGFMLTRLIDAGSKRPVLWSGLIWSAWHLPLIVSGQYAAGPLPLVSGFAFMLGTTAGGYIAARLRLESGSVWPAVVYHAAWNALIQGSFDAFTAGGSVSRTTNVWTGESGVLVVLVNVALAATLMARPWEARRRPGENAMAVLDLRNA